MQVLFYGMLQCKTTRKETLGNSLVNTEKHGDLIAKLIG